MSSFTPFQNSMPTAGLQEGYYYDPVATPLSLQMTPYQQYMMARTPGSLQYTNAYLEPDDMSWMIPEDSIQLQQLQEEDETRLLPTNVGERQADAALASWGIEKPSFKPSMSRLSLSARNSDIDLKNFLIHRGNRKLDGLYKAAAKGDVNSIMNIMKREGPNAPINTLDENECTPLMYAVLADSTPAIEMLLHCSAKREEVDSMGHTAVHYGAFFGKSKALKFLIESASNWIPRDIYGRTPLHWSTANKNTKCLLVLLKHASVVIGNINPRDNENMTPLHCAAQYCRPKHILVLYEADCDYTALDIEGKTALHWTVDNPDSSCIEALVNCYPSLLNVKDGAGQTILHLTAKKGATHLIETLLDIEGIEIDAKDYEDRTPLHLACMERQSSCVQLLLLRKALDSCIDNSGLTALHYAVLENSQQCTQLLVHNNYTTHVPSADDKSITPLMIATDNGFNDIVQVLLSREEIVQAINQVDPTGKSALHFACELGSMECVVTLLEQGADSNLFDKARYTPLSLVCKNGHTSCVQPLVSGGAEIHLMDGDGHLPLHKAVLYKHSSVVEELVLLGSLVEALDEEGNTPLQLAVSANSEEMVKTLLKIGADPNSMNGNGQTALHTAAMEGYSVVLSLLLENGGYVNNRDGTENRYTPLVNAQQMNHSECVDILIQYGGVSVDIIRNIAAVSIQTAYRRHRAQKMLQLLKIETLAAIIIQKHTRGFLKRKWYHKTKKQNKAASMIQAAVRGFLQRKRFSKLVRIHRQEEKQRELIERFGNMILNLKEASVIQTITMETSSETEKVGEERMMLEQQTRIERALRMREIYVKRQQEWEEFRKAEKQRRLEKAHEEKLQQMNGILKDSQARRHFIHQHFHYSSTVRSHHQAAVTIQRAYREAKRHETWRKRQQEAKDKRRRAREMFAALVIQNAWRRYKEWKKFESAYLCPIYTSPVVHLTHPMQINDKGQRSYERSTLASGAGRRKLHQTQFSGFKIFRPLPTLPAVDKYTTPPTIFSNRKEVVSRSLGGGWPSSSRVERMKNNWPWVDRLLITPNEHKERTRTCQENRGSVTLPQIHSTTKTDRNHVVMATTTRTHIGIATNPIKLPQVIEN